MKKQTETEKLTQFNPTLVWHQQNSFFSCVAHYKVMGAEQITTFRKTIQNSLPI